MRERPDRDTYFMEVARVVSWRSTCLRAQVGAVLVRDNHILSAGYNGSPRGLPHCTPETCGPHIDHCRATVHAELNAILSAAFHGTQTANSTLYTTLFPCAQCAYAIINAGIARVVAWEDYENNYANSILYTAKIPVHMLRRRQWLADMIMLEDPTSMDLDEPQES